ncbi:MAG: hypothetical protein WCW40_02995 [Bacteroidota bacterium]
MKTLKVIFLAAILFTVSYAQDDITNKLGDNGAFRILKSDNTTELLTVDAQSGVLSSTKVALTPEGGIAIKVKNRTGALTVKGTLVTPFGADQDNACTLAPATSDRPSGVMYSSNVAVDGDCWIIVAGIADVLLKDNVATTRGWVVITSSIAGQADCTNDVSGANHDKECGHFLETKTGSTNQLAKAIIHFR